MPIDSKSQVRHQQLNPMIRYILFDLSLSSNLSPNNTTMLNL